MSSSSLKCCECKKKDGFTWVPYSTAVKMLCVSCSKETMHIAEHRFKTPRNTGVYEV